MWFTIIMEFAVYTLMAFMEVELKFLFWPENSLIHSNIIFAYIDRILALNYQQPCQVYTNRLFMNLNHKNKISYKHAGKFCAQLCLTYIAQP